MTSFFQILKVCLLLFIFSTLAKPNTTPLKYNVGASGNHYPFYTNDSAKPGIPPRNNQKSTQGYIKSIKDKCMSNIPTQN